MNTEYILKEGIGANRKDKYILILQNVVVIVLIYTSTTAAVVKEKGRLINMIFDEAHEKREIRSM